ncbi:MAG: hypothetical protein A2V46_00275 [Bacteroidetes bacterium RBG_19FT_COMBO_42_7]|nr:MAG: hypothetical protein A2V46_00275 [Bacteroidetes bacterium RBG_19FT_COMBO_42_7]
MNKLIVLLFPVLLTAFVSDQYDPLPSGAEESLPAGLEAGSTIVKKCQDFTVTGNGSSGSWESTEWINLIHQGSGVISYETRVKVLYSSTGIYFLFRCEDEKLTTSMKDDNLNLWEEDVVEVFLWTSEDFPVYFEYEISPMDFELPIIVPNYKGKFLGWLPWNYGGDRRILHATSSVGGEKKSGSTVSAWIAEFFIPYKLLNPLPQVPPVSGTKWRANMYRIDYDKGASHFAWQKTARSFHEYNSFGTFIFE